MEIDNYQEFTKFLQIELIKVFKFTVEYLNNNNYKWCTCGGTMLGAVRHNNIIPWDDDIDIYMPRKDYDKLLKNRVELNKLGFDIVCIELTPDYYAPFAKIVKIDSTWQEREFLDMNTGVYVDIFPLDYFDCSDETIKKYQHTNHVLERKYYYSIVHCSIPKILHSFKSRNYKEIGVMLKSLLYPYCRRQIHLQNYLKRQEFYKKQDGYKCVCISQWYGKIFKKEWFENMILVPFADFQVFVPKEYDKYLTLLYGDYMKLPPVEKRVTHHHQYYINLSKRLSKKEIIKRVNLGKRFEIE